MGVVWDVGCVNQFEIIKFCLTFPFTSMHFYSHMRVRLHWSRELSKNQVWTNQNSEVLNLKLINHLLAFKFREIFLLAKKSQDMLV